jgi:hypothetical membrane protein
MNHSASLPGPRAAAGDGHCDPAAGRTRALLAYGVLAGPVYLLTGLIQALTRDGFDLSRHDLSLLANGSLGWIQITNLIVSGLMTVAAAAGLHRAWSGCRGSTWGPRLLAGYGAGLVAAGIFVADPTDGFPPGTPAGQGPVSWHGTLHLIAGGIGFLALVAACFVIGSRFAAAQQRGWAWSARLTGVVFLAGFAGIAAGSGHRPAVAGFWIAVIVAWAWISALSASQYREAGR